MSSPPVIAVEQAKGGVLKTTTTVALAEAAAEAGANVLAIDTDPQGSLVRWSQLAEAAGKPLRSTVAGLATRNLAARLPIMAAGHHFVFVDGPPVRDDLVQAGVDAADLIVMPVPPKLADMDRVAGLMKMAANAGKKLIAVQTLTRAETRQALAARETLTDMGLIVAQTVIPVSMPVAELYGARPRGKLAAYGRDLLAELLPHLNGTGGQP